MKLLLTGDWHLTDKQPANRKGSYAEDCLEKVEQIINIYKEEGCYAILQPGDFFDSFHVSDRFMSRLLKLMGDYIEPLIFVVSGQHDRRYHSDDLSNTSLAVIAQPTNVELIDSTMLLLEDTSIYGAGWNYDISVHAEGKCKILLTHKMIVKNEPLFPGQEGHSYAEELLEDHDFDLIVSGDNHKQFIVTTKDGKTLVNCGSLMRSSISQADHHPAVVIYDTETKKHTRVPLKIRPAEDVLDFTESVDKKETDEKLTAFIKQMQEGKQGIEQGLSFLDNLRNRMNKLDQAINEILEEVLTNVSDK